MMKMTYKIKEMALASLCVVGLVACSSDDLTEGTESSSSSNKQVEVTLNIGVQEPEETTRAWDGTQSDNQAGENMYSWFVIVAQNNQVVAIVEKGSVSDLEKDEVTLTTTLTAGGTYDFYSFANIDRSSIDALNNLTTGSSLTKSTVESLTYTVCGNGFDINSNHIPMSNYQSKTIPESGEVELWVVRMLAKVTLRFTNDTESDVLINSATLSEITDNESNNLMLLPNPTNYGSTGACTPNLNGSPSTVDYEYKLSTSLTIASGEKDSLTFYVNESATPTQNAHGLFTLTLNCGDGTEYKRYALITNDSDDWNYIARNDYRVIPITLQEYNLGIEVYDWPPIGVYPASVINENGLFTATFHAAGHFHIVPVVTKYGDATPLSYGQNTDTWDYDSWTNVGTIPDDFYEKDASGTSSDGCENGGVPVWDSTNHFIFGYLKNTRTGNAATKAYHDLTINVYRTGTPATRQLTYHLCIVKDLAY